MKCFFKVKCIAAMASFFDLYDILEPHDFFLSFFFLILAPLSEDCVHQFKKQKIPHLHDKASQAKDNQDYISSHEKHRYH